MLVILSFEIKAQNNTYDAGIYSFLSTNICVPLNEENLRLNNTYGIGIGLFLKDNKNAYGIVFDFNFLGNQEILVNKDNTFVKYNQLDLVCSSFFYKRELLNKSYFSLEGIISVGYTEKNLEVKNNYHIPKIKDKNPIIGSMGLNFIVPVELNILYHWNVGIYYLIISFISMNNR